MWLHCLRGSAPLDWSWFVPSHLESKSHLLTGSTGTVRDNITFGSAFDSVWYETVVDACALKHDFLIMMNGDLVSLHLTPAYRC